MPSTRSVLISLAAAALCSSCQPVSGDGQLVTIERQLGTFSKVHVTDQLSVSIVRGAPKITITADENLIDRIETDIDGETLKLRLTSARDITPTHADIGLSSELLRHLEVRDGSQVTAAATDGSEWHLDVSGGSTCKLSDVIADHFFLDISDDSQADVSGFAALRVQVEASGHSRANTDGLATPAAEVDASGGSNVTVRASDSVEIDTSGNSQIFVTGSPGARSINGDSGSQITFVTGQ